MTAESPLPRPLVRFARTPKGILLLIFAGFIALDLLVLGPAAILPNLVAAAATAAILDVAIVRLRQERWVFPDGAILTGLIVAFILRPQESWLTVVLATALAIGSKHLLRTRWSNVFNPAALALVFSALLLRTGESWWGALPDSGLIGLLPLAAAGIWLANRLNKLPMLLAFLGAYFSLFTIAGFFGDPIQVAEVFRTPDLQAALFFGCFMLDDPPTSPVRYEDQVVFGLLVATAAYYIFMAVGGVYYLPAGLLIGNAWESSRRLVWLRQPSRPVPAPAQVKTKIGWAANRAASQRRT